MQDIDLVFHEGDQRRDDQSNALHEYGWKLVAERFSAACGKNGQGRAPGQERFDDLPLTFPEARVAEVF